MQFCLFVIALLPFAYATYDELSVLQEVLERTSSTSTQTPSTTTTEPEPSTTEVVVSETPIIPSTLTIERILASTISSVESSSQTEVVEPAVTGSPIMPVDETIQVMTIAPEDKEENNKTTTTEIGEQNNSSTVSTVVASSEVSTTVDSSSDSSTSETSSSAISSVSAETSTTEELVAEVTEEMTSSTASPLIEVTTEADEHFFFGIKKPDLATIYRRLFPFRDQQQQDEFHSRF